MLFNSFEFLLFLPLVFALYWLFQKKIKIQNALVVVASYVFYGWWDWRFLILIFITSISSFLSGLYIERSEGNRNRQKAISAANILLNLLILGVFKYYNFFVDNIVELFRQLGCELDWPTIHIILPVGISFYTFQALSYSIDVYQGKLKATRDLVEFCAFISFFPQLVAGPIERATNLLPQFQRKRVFDYGNAVDGLRQMLWGFFKKMLIADNCAIAVNWIWANYSGQHSFVLFLGAILFTFQIYCDFSGYSDIAIGCARLFGIRLMRNFNFPYFSRSIPEFWRRWHISLTTWFRDYIYFPLGGSRCSKAKTIRNVFVVWGISGLWHGANWTFVFWGLYHAFILNVYNLLGIKTEKETDPIGILLLFSDVFKILLTFLLAVFGWIIFRAENLTQAVDYFGGMFHTSLFDVVGGLDILDGKRATLSLLFIVIMILVEWFNRTKEHGLQISNNSFIGRHVVIRYSVYLAIMYLICVFAGTQSEFIYFQF